jgi:hypothetical protein
MRIAKWMLALLALFACGQIAVGCGGDDDESSSGDEPAAEETSDPSSDDPSTKGSTPDDLLAACEEAVAGTPAEDVGKAGCEQAADAFETCLTEAENLNEDSASEKALAACQDAADQAVKALEAAPGG